MPPFSIPKTISEFRAKVSEYRGIVSEFKGKVSLRSTRDETRGCLRRRTETTARAAACRFTRMSTAEPSRAAHDWMITVLFATWMCAK